MTTTIRTEQHTIAARDLQPGDQLGYDAAQALLAGCRATEIGTDITVAAAERDDIDGTIAVRFHADDEPEPIQGDLQVTVTRRYGWVAGIAPVRVLVLAVAPSRDGLPYITVRYAGISYVVREIFPTMQQALDAPPAAVSATSGAITVVLTPLAGQPGYWVQTQTEEGDAWGDAMTVHIEDDETPQAYAQRWANLYAAS